MNKCFFQRMLALACLVALAACQPQTPITPLSETLDRPNVIVVLTDDQGWGDVGYHGNPHIQTPLIDSLAGSGVIFENFYVSPRCAPTRAALMTGRYPEKTGVFHVTDGGHIMAQSEKTMAEYFQEAGYATAIFGKWHIGDHYPYWPNDQGFEHSLIHGGGAVGQLSDHPDNYWDMTKPLSERKQCYFDPTLFENREPIKTTGYITDIFTEGAMDFVDAHPDQPFFLYLAYNAPHGPYQAPQEYLDLYQDLPKTAAADDNGRSHRLSDYEMAQYVYAMMTNLDDNLQRLKAHLQQQGKWANTVFVFLSDNGPDAYRFNGVLRAKKGTVYEGGIKVPAFLHYPHLEGGKTVAMPAAHIDILPTVAALCSISLEDNLDGENLLPVLKGKANPPNRYLVSRETNAFEPYRDVMLREGDWKLRAEVVEGSPVFELYNLAEDPSEANDLLESHPEKVAELRAKMDGWYEEVRQAKNLKIHPIYVGSEEENPVRLSRHEKVNSYANGWFSSNYLGYFPLFVKREGLYNVKLIFREPLTKAGRLEMKLGPVGREIPLDGSPLTEYTFSDLYLREGETVFEAWFQNRETVVSPFFVEVERVGAGR